MSKKAFNDAVAQAHAVIELAQELAEIGKLDVAAKGYQDMVAKAKADHAEAIAALEAIKADAQKAKASAKKAQETADGKLKFAEMQATAVTDKAKADAQGMYDFARDESSAMHKKATQQVLAAGKELAGVKGKIKEAQTEYDALQKDIAALRAKFGG